MTAHTPTDEELELQAALNPHFTIVDKEHQEQFRRVVEAMDAGRKATTVKAEIDRLAEKLSDHHGCTCDDCVFFAALKRAYLEGVNRAKRVKAIQGAIDLPLHKANEENRRLRKRLAVCEELLRRYREAFEAADSKARAQFYEVYERHHDKLRGTDGF